MRRDLTRTLMGDPPPGRTPWADPQQASVPGVRAAPVPRVPNPAPLPPVAKPTSGSEDKGSAPIPPRPAAEVREIEPIQLHLEGSPPAPPTPPPVFVDVDPRTLLVEEAYQRDLTARSLAHIRQIAATWDWRKYHPPVVVMTDAGGLILDGQHTAIAAASRPDLPTIPVQLVEADDVAERAQAFLGLNTGQLAHSPVGLHKAAVAAGDVTACAVDRICAAAGVTIRQAFGGARWNPGDTSSVSGVRFLLTSIGERRTTQVLQSLVAARLAPISTTHIRAAERVFTHEDFADSIEPLDAGGGAQLSKAILALGDDAHREAAMFAKAQCVPMYQALAVIWGRKAKKRRAG